MNKFVIVYKHIHGDKTYRGESLYGKTSVDTVHAYDAQGAVYYFEYFRGSAKYRYEILKVTEINNDDIPF